MSNTKLNIALVSPEFYPLAKTGGLADVVGALSKALSQLGHQVAVFLPNYRVVQSEYNPQPTSLRPVQIPIGEKQAEAKLKEHSLPGNKSKIYLIDSLPYFDRQELYRDPKTGVDYKDNDERFILFSRAVLEFLKALDFKPDVIHCNEWQSALVCAYFKTIYQSDPHFTKAGTLFSIHNLAYQGVFPKESFSKLALSQDLYYPMSPFEFFGKLNFLKTGIHYSDLINTVSETYAKEIQTVEYGCGLQGALKARSTDLYGIVNGVDYSEWSPELDKLIPTRYGSGRLGDKLKNKIALFKECRFSVPKLNWPALGMISRLADQKGFDLLAEIASDLLKKELVLVILGTGDVRYEKLLKQLEIKFSDRLRAFITFDERLAHLIEAGGDIFLMPSRYEPCGLNQLYSLKYGTVPVVRATGGLADTIQDYSADGRGTGFSFKEYSSEEFLKTIERVLTVYRDKAKWEVLQRTGMSQDFSWERSAQKYIGLYHLAIKTKAKA